jgi:hypothetical protein
MGCTASTLLLGPDSHPDAPDPEPGSPQQQEQGPVEDSSKGIEMDADFEGAMHDMPEEEGERDRDSDDDSGDERVYGSRGGLFGRGGPAASYQDRFAQVSDACRPAGRMEMVEG